jgi:hypothetical protein
MLFTTPYLFIVSFETGVDCSDTFLQKTSALSGTNVEVDRVI